MAAFRFGLIFEKELLHGYTEIAHLWFRVFFLWIGHFLLQSHVIKRGKEWLKSPDWNRTEGLCSFSREEKPATTVPGFGETPQAVVKHDLFRYPAQNTEGVNRTSWPFFNTYHQNDCGANVSSSHTPSLSHATQSVVSRRTVLGLHFGQIRGKKHYNKILSSLGYGQFLNPGLQSH